MHTISFDELVAGSADVRVTDDESVPAISIRDIIMVVCNKNNNDAGETWRKLPDSYKQELQEFITTFQFPGRGQTPQPVITLPGALKLIMWLPGTMAKDFRSKACDILTRYLAGDASLVSEIECNDASEAAVNVMARQSMKRSADELEIQERKLVLRERELKLAEREHDIHERTALIPAKVRDYELTQQQKIMEFYQSLCPNRVIDDRAKLLFKDRVMNLMVSQPLLGNDPNSNPKSVSDIATSMGKHFSTTDIVKLGTLVAAKYRDCYGPKATPGKHPQFVHGRMCEVNHYTEKDHDMVRAAIIKFTKQ